MRFPLPLMKAELGDDCFQVGLSAFGGSGTTFEHIFVDKGVIGSLHLDQQGHIQATPGANIGDSGCVCFKTALPLQLFGMIVGNSHECNRKQYKYQDIFLPLSNTVSSCREYFKDFAKDFVSDIYEGELARRTRTTMGQAAEMCCVVLALRLASPRWPAPRPQHLSSTYRGAAGAFSAQCGGRAAASIARRAAASSGRAELDAQGAAMRIQP